MLETPARIEPCLFDDGVPASLADLAVDLQREAAELGRGLDPESALELADFVRVMNCYYSNLIEGHNTRPKDIERALADAELEPERRALALEAKAHVLVQRRIDRMHLDGTLPTPTSVAFVTWTHRTFYDAMPEELRTLERPDGSSAPIDPGAFRSATADDVAVGRHLPPSSARIGDSMAYFSERFAAAEKSASARIIGLASAYHRLNYIRPFPDGNGRVSRLMSHAMALRAGVGGLGLWSISRGLARGLEDRGEYKRMVDHADSPRRGDLDGRRNLSASALREFCEWFLMVALDQIRFSTAVFALDRLEARYRALADDVADDKRAADLISVVLRHGAIERGDAAVALRTSERTARTTVSGLLRNGFLRSSSPKGSLRIAFPLDYRERLFPNLFTDAEFPAPERPSTRP